MSLITLRNMGIALSGPLFSGLNLSISAGDRIGIVAANGRGKSTLLKCIAGLIEPTQGEVIRARGLTLSLVEQDMSPNLATLSFRDAAVDALAPDARDYESWRADVILEDMGVPEAYRDRPLSALSGGWQRLALMARAMMTEPDVLVLDEPTNHLDLARIRQLEAWLTGLPRAMAAILTSHDRAFLDATTQRTLFLRPERSQIFSLPYSPARLALDEADAAQVRQYDRDMKEAGQLRRQAEKLKNIGINSGSDLLTVKTKQLKARAEKLEEAARPAHLDRSSGAIRLAGQTSHARVLVTLEDVHVTTPDGTLLFRTGRRFIRQGDRIVLLGRNGAGKTRLVTMIRRAIIGPPEMAAHDETTIRVTPSLVLGYGDQALADLDDRSTPHQAIISRFEIGDQRARSLLAGAGLSVEMQERPLGRLSGGQKARLGLLVLRLREPNFYLLDEPTNHLDIEGQEALEGELLKTEASCLLISHDRSFVRAVGNRFWLIDGRKLLEVEGPDAFFAASVV